MHQELRAKIEELRSGALEQIKFLESLPAENINAIIINITHSKPEEQNCTISGVVGGPPHFVLHGIMEIITNLFDNEPEAIPAILVHIMKLINEQNQGTGAAPEDEKLNQKLNEIFSQTRH